MLLALFLASGSALLGGALALVVRRRRVLLGLTRTFAFAAAAGVVAMHLLPEALDAIGVQGLLWAAAGFALPGLLEWRAKSLGPGLRARGFSPARVAAEIGFLALVAHSLLEGVALSAAASGSGSHLDLEIALVAHHAPLTAAVILPFLDLLPARGVALRVLGVAFAGGLGALFGSAAPTALTAALPQNVASAVMAGALLHVVADEIHAQPFDALWERGADLAAALLGAGIAVVAAVFGGTAQGPFESAFTGLFLPCAPALLAADLIVAIPRNRRRARAQAPELDGLLVSMRELGVVAMLVQLGLGAAAFFASSLFAPGEGRPPESAPSYLERLLAETARRAPRRLLAFLLGSLALSLLPTSLDISALSAAAGAALSFLLFSALSTGAAASIATALLAMLLPWAPGASLLVPALALGPLVFRRESWRGDLKRRATGALLALLLGALAAALLLGTGFDARVRSAAVAVPLLVAQPLGACLRLAPVESIAAALLLLLAFLTLWRTGPRGWFLTLKPGEHREMPPDPERFARGDSLAM